MPDHSIWMQRCLDLATNGIGSVAPNPMVGCVLVQGDQLLAEGWHKAFGAAHAEVECLNAWGQRPIPADATLYVNLEPCAHHGKTPPCADLIIERGIKNVVVGLQDPFPAVSGMGIKRMKDAGIEVIGPINEAQCRWHQRRFLTSVENDRPYVILKWARSSDGFLDQHPRNDRAVQRISGAASNSLVHTWRTQEQAILVGSRTVLNDDPQLTSRLVDGRSPIRFILDRNGITPARSKVYDGSSPSILFTNERRGDIAVEQIMIGKDEDPIECILNSAQERSIRSILVEGGAELLNHFIEKDSWDEARVLSGKPLFGKGTIAPTMHAPALRTFSLEEDTISLYINERSPSLLGIAPLPPWFW